MNRRGFLGLLAAAPIAAPAAVRDGFRSMQFASDGFIKNASFIPRRLGDAKLETLGLRVEMSPSLKSALDELRRKNPMSDECECRNCSADDLLIPQMKSPPIVPSYENQGTGYDPGASGYERQGRRSTKDCVKYCGETCDCMPPPIVPATPRTIIAFSGLAGSGKSTAAAHLVERHGFERVRFAGPLKDMMRALGLSEREIEGDLKEKPCALLCGRTPRHGMQTLGTEWGRNLIGPQFWINAWRAAVDRLPPAVPVVVDDCRFHNEAAAIMAARGVLVRIERAGVGAGAAGHVSEGNVLPFQISIENNGTEADLFRRIDHMLVNFTWADAVA